MLNAFVVLPLIIFLQINAWAKLNDSDGSIDAKSKILFGENYDQSLNLDWLNGLSFKTVNESSYNPGNTSLEIDRTAIRSDLNLDYGLKYKNLHKLVIRPRVYSQYQEIEYKNKPSNQLIQRNRGKIDLTEFFVEAWLKDEISITMGLQNYQWGPAELMSPSNPIYHFNRDQKSVLWKDKGRNLIRANWSPSSSSSYVLIAEPINNGETSFIADKEFKSKYLLKSEWRSLAESQNYIGTSFGAEEENSPFIGAYSNFLLIEGLSIYSDFRFTQDGFVYIPKSTNNGLTVDMLADDRYQKGNWHHLGVYGFRLEQQSWDLRVEYIYNSRGYESSDFDAAFISASAYNPKSDSNYPRFLRSGLEVYGKHYAYFSLRVPNLGGARDGTYFFRYLHSGLDASGIFQNVLEWSLDDHIIFVGEFKHVRGDKNREFTIGEKSSIFAGLKYMM